MNQKLFDSLPENLQNLIKNNDYYQAFDYAPSLSAKQAIAELFLEYHYPQEWTYFVAMKIKDILVKLCVELDDLDNPFINYVDEYINHNGKVDRDLLVSLNNLYAKDIIDDHNLDASDEDGDELHSILYNKNLLTHDDLEFLITSYYWLTNAYNVKRMNFNALANEASSPAVKEVAQEYIANPNLSSKAIRNAIIYDISKDDALSNNATNNYTLRSAKDIKNLLHVAANKNNTSGNKSDKVTSITADISKLSDDEKKDLFNRIGVQTI